MPSHECHQKLMLQEDTLLQNLDIRLWLPQSIYPAVEEHDKYEMRIIILWQGRACVEISGLDMTLLKKNIHKNPRHDVTKVHFRRSNVVSVTRSSWDGKLLKYRQLHCLAKRYGFQLLRRLQTLS